MIRARTSGQLLVIDPRHGIDGRIADGMNAELVMSKFSNGAGKGATRLFNEPRELTSRYTYRQCPP